jgi:hypothetical protein
MSTNALLLTAVILAAPAAAHADPAIRIYESSKLSEVTEGETTVAGSPDEAYATVSDFGRWTTMFPDIRRVTVTRQNGVDAMVSLDYSDHRNNLHFHNDPAHRRVWFENTHSRADLWADLTFLPGPGANTTTVHARVYADVTGAAGLFVSESRLRHGRTDRIQGDLAKLRIYFATHAVAAPTVAANR